VADACAPASERHTEEFSTGVQNRFAKCSSARGEALDLATVEGRKFEERKARKQTTRVSVSQKWRWMDIFMHMDPHLVHPAWDDAHQTVGAPCRAASVCCDCVVEEELEMLRGVVPLALWEGGPNSEECDY
jgi:hypothetical protein